jgi:hypothetical protein
MKRMLGISTVGLVVVILLLLLLFGAFPIWPHATTWGYTPSGLLFVALIVVVILLATGRL